MEELNTEKVAIEGLELSVKELINKIDEAYATKSSGVSGSVKILSYGSSDLDNMRKQVYKSTYSVAMNTAKEHKDGDLSEYLFNCHWKDDDIYFFIQKPFLKL